MATDKKKVISDSIFLTIGNVLMRLKGLIFLPIIIAAVGMDNYGAFVQILINPKLIIPFCTLALGMGFYRYTSKYSEDQVEDLSRDFWTVLTFSTLLSIIGASVLYLVSPLISEHILDGIGLASLRLSSVFVILGTVWEQLTKYMQGRKQFKFYSIYQVLYGLFPYLGFVIGVVFTGQIFYGLLYFAILESLLVIILFILVARHLKIVLPSLATFIHFMKYSWALLFSMLEGGLLSKADRYFVGYFLGPAAIGIYNIVYSAANMMYVFKMPFHKYADTYLPELWDNGERDRVRGQLKEGLLYYLVLSAGSLVLLTLYLRPAIQIILQKSVASIDNFELLVFVTGLGILMAGMNGFYYRVIRYREQNQYQLFLETGAVVINVALNFLLIPVLGLLGAGIATFASYAAILVVCNLQFTIGLDRDFVWRIARVALALVPMFFIFDAYTVTNIFALIGSALLVSVIYLGALFLLRVVNIRMLRNRFA